MAQKILKTSLKAGDELELRLELSQDGRITGAKLTGIGGPAMLKLLAEWKGRIEGELKAVALPEGQTGPELMLKELILKARGEWTFPYEDPELCHCRAIPTAIVDQAIISGAHQPEIVSRWTSASTSCGTCRRDVISILNYRLNRRSA
jgi:NAD(P)H-nitrite reductase large subunit